MGALGSSAIVETAIGLILVFFLGAGICTAIVEAVASLLSFRSRLLWRAVARWFSTADDGDERRAFSQALSLATGPFGASDEATELERWTQKAPAPAPDGTPTTDPRPDIVTSAGTTPRRDFFNALPGVLDEVAVLKRTKSLNRESAIAALSGVFARPRELTTEELASGLGRLVSRLPDTMRDDLEARTAWIERWYDAEMERLGTAYRSRIRWYAGVVALPLVLFMGIDAVHITSELYRDPTRRQVLVTAAERQIEEEGVVCPEEGGTTTTTTTTPTTTEPAATATEPAEEPDPLADAQAGIACAERLVASIDGLSISRWQGRPGDDGRLPSTVLGWLSMIAGLTISAAAFTAGAPWWFSVVKKLMDARRALTPKST